jgi:riboflavin-specific deaminase-like protein
MTVAVPSDRLNGFEAMPERVAGGGCDDARWRAIMAMRAGTAAEDMSGEPVYGPLVAGEKAGRLVIGQFGQSLDGRIATPSGESKYLNGVGGLAHLHRLRALVDGVVVGVATVVADDPMLTVRLVAGGNPARVVIDPNGRVHPSARMFAEDGARRIVVTCVDTRLEMPEGVEIIRLSRVEGRFAPGEIVAALASVGLPQLLVEGGAETVSRFLQVGALDRLHVSIAPVLVGGGRPGVTLSNVQGLADCLRPIIEVHRLGEDILFDCAFHGPGEGLMTPSSP